jgi:ERCC4-type nuclease
LQAERGRTTLHGLRAPTRVVDTFERRSAVPRALETLGADVRFRSLRAGDYAVGRHVIAERKTVSDLHRSVIEGRIWRQLEAVREVADSAFIVVEGRSVDDGPLGPQAIRGCCITAIGMGVRLLFSRDAKDTGAWLYGLALRCQQPSRPRDRLVWHEPSTRGQQAARRMLAGVPGVSLPRASALMKRYGSIAEMLRHGPEDWQTVAGVGPRSAAALAAAFGIPAAEVDAQG